MEISLNNCLQFSYIISKCPQSQHDIDDFLRRPEPTFLDKFVSVHAPTQYGQGALRTVSMDVLNLMQANGNCLLIVGDINNDGILRLLCIQNGAVHVVQDPNFTPQRVEFSSIRLYSYYVGGGSVGTASGPTLVPSTSSASGGMFGPLGSGLFGPFPPTSTSSSSGGPPSSRSSSSSRSVAAPVPAAGGGGGGGGAIPQSTAPNTDCAICMDDFSEDARQISQINCSHGPHAYHTQCIQGLQRSGSQRKCPVCRDYYTNRRPVRRRPAAAGGGAASPRRGSASGGGGAAPSQQQRKIQQLMGLGVTRQVAKQALQAAGGDVNMAGAILLQTM